ncbi:MAG: carboxymuconolactone decarboxylase family protein [bacterium]|nr:carboxymuconolactone decarboxylase family protein [Candidatus Sumerlaeota bacterium]
MSASTSPFAELTANERGLRAIERLAEIFKIPSLPEGLRVLAASESGINDLYMNLNRQFQDGKLSQKTKLIIGLGVAAAAGCADMTVYFAQAAQAAGRTREETIEAVAIAFVCGIYNGYYRFRSQVPADMRAVYEAFRAPFNANTFVKPALPVAEMESICIAVSSANNCSKCVEGHMVKGKAEGLTDEQIDEIIKCGAVAAAAARITSALSPAPASA